MERKMLDFAVSNMKCIEGGTKEACVYVREYLQNCMVPKYENKDISSVNSAVTSDEFIEAVRVLMGYAWENRKDDNIPETFYCDKDCSYIDTHYICPGEFQLAQKDEVGKPFSKKLCPHFMDSSNV
jgi:hypothetical protein